MPRITIAEGQYDKLAVTVSAMEFWLSGLLFLSTSKP